MFKALLKKKIDAQQTFIQTAMDAQRGLTAEEQAQFDALQREIDDLKKSIAGNNYEPSWKRPNPVGRLSGFPLDKR